MNESIDDELMVRYLEGAASDDEVAVLERRLRGDAEARRAFVRMSHLQALFADLPRQPLLAAPLPRRRWWLPAAATAVAAAALVAIAWWMLAPVSALPTVTAMQGLVACERALMGVPLRLGQRLVAHDRLAVDAAATLDLTWADGTRVTITGESVVAVGGPGVTLDLHHGELRAVVGTRRPGWHLAIATPEGVARDIGTDFVVHRDSDGTVVSVTTGLVAFTAPAGAVTIPAGRRATAAPGQAPRLDVIATAPPQTVPVPPARSDGPPIIASAPAPAPASKPAPTTVTGVVTAVNPARKSLTLIDDATGVADDYRPFYAGGDVAAMTTAITTAKVGDHLTVTYTEREGRRVLAITPAGGRK